MQLVGAQQPRLRGAAVRDCGAVVAIERRRGQPRVGLGERGLLGGDEGNGRLERLGAADLEISPGQGELGRRRRGGPDGGSVLHQFGGGHLQREGGAAVRAFLGVVAAAESSLLNTTTTAEFGPMVMATVPLLTASGTGVTSDAATSTLSCANDGPFGRPIACHAASGLACSSSILYSMAWLGVAPPLTATVTVRLSRYDTGPPFSQNERNTDGCCCPSVAS
jgi:hypothetical protein